MRRVEKQEKGLKTGGRMRNMRRVESLKKG